MSAIDYDEREAQFDIRRLDDGDIVEVFHHAERAWVRGRFEVTAAGELFIRTRDGEKIRLYDALQTGLRRVLH